jgi:hypothetical protein
MSLITFIIPVRHQDNAPDWPRLKANLAQTLASIAAQTHGDWRGVVVCNEGADLPPLPANFADVRVTFEPNRLHERGDATRDDFLDAFRFDKGRRVLAGMLARRDSRFFMIVDDDDFVSRGIAAYVAQHPDTPGWKIDKGYVWSDGGKLLYEHRDFNHICGTSLIIRSDVYDLPASAEVADIDWVKAMLGSHHGVDKLMEERRTPLTPLPFPGAVYRVGHPGSHSQTPSILRRFVLTPGWKRRPRNVLRQLARLRPLTGQARREFFGAKA